MPRPRYSIGFLLALIAVIGASLAIYRYLNPPPAYPLPTKHTLRQVERGDAYDFRMDFGRTWETLVTEELFSGRPTWDRRRNLNPPLSANEAIVKADQFRRRLLNGEANNIDYEHQPIDYLNSPWRLDSAELVPFHESEGHWYWRIRFSRLAEGPFETLPSGDMCLVVLMDGAVLEPVLEPPVKPELYRGEFRLPVYEKPNGE